MESGFKGTSGEINRLKRCPGIIYHSRDGYFYAVFQASKAYGSASGPNNRCGFLCAKSRTV